MTVETVILYALVCDYSGCHHDAAHHGGPGDFETEHDALDYATQEGWVFGGRRAVYCPCHEGLRP